MSKTNMIDKMPTIYSESIDRIKESLQEREVLERNLKSKLFSLGWDYSSKAIGEIILNNNVIQSKIDFYIASVLFKERVMYSCMSGKPTTYGYQHILLTLISDNIELLVSLAGIVGTNDKLEKQTHPFCRRVGFTLKYIILDEYEKAEKYISELNKAINQKGVKFDSGYTLVADGIIHNDQSKINEGINQMVKYHNRRQDIKYTDEELFSIPIIGLSKLAILKGFEVDYKEVPFAPKIMIEQHDIEYPNLDFLDFLLKGDC